jgi:cell division protein FtsQ
MTMSTRHTVHLRPKPQPEPVGVPVDVRVMRMASAWLMFALVLLLVAGLGWSLLRLQVFTIKGITVLGDVRHNNVLTIQANVAGKLRGNFFTANLDQIKEAFESVPWIRQARVEREFPNRLRVTLQEHQVAAFWGEDQDARLVNSFGEVFEVNLDELDASKMVRLNGPDSQSQEVYNMYQAVAPRFQSLGMTVKSLQLTERGSWRVVLSQGGKVELGRGVVSDVLPRIERLQQTLAKVTQQLGRSANAMESADLRYDNGYAIRLKGVSTTDAASKT